MLNPTPVESKRRLRTEFRNRLSSLSLGEVHDLSLRIVNRLKATAEFQRSPNVLCCMSFEAEVRTSTLISDLAADPSRSVFLPRVDRRGVMHVHRYPCELRQTSIGLLQPRVGEPQLSKADIESKLNLAILPGMAFDRRAGFRLGRGKGYFDRFLAGKKFPSIGLAFERQLISEFPSEAHDIRMDMVITEESLYRF